MKKSPEKGKEKGFLEPNFGQKTEIFDQKNFFFDQNLALKILFLYLFRAIFSQIIEQRKIHYLKKNSPQKSSRKNFFKNKIKKNFDQKNFFLTKIWL